MVTVHSVDEVRAWKRDAYWHVAPSGEHVALGDHVVLGRYVTLGDRVRLCNFATVGNRVEIGNRVVISDLVSLGNCVILGDDTTMGFNTMLGFGTILGRRVTLGSNVRLGFGVVLGNGVVLGDDVRLGDGTKLDDNVTSEQLNRDFIAALPESFIAWKYVDKNRMSLTGSFKKIRYTKGKTIHSDGEISDQWRGEGLHVVRAGYTLGMAGLESLERPGVKRLRVLVYRKDVLFAGFPGYDFRLRVRKLKVLD